MSLFKKTGAVLTDDAKVQEIITRGVERVYPSKDALEAKLKCGEQLSLYLGIDPTGPILHLGHAVCLLKLRQFQDLGHHVIVLYGGFTAKIGDPTGKGEARQQLSGKDIKKNTANYKKLIGKILDLKKSNIRFVDNEKWSNKLTPADLITLASRFTVSQILERDMFQERLKQGKEIHLHEFLYPLFQAYDAVTLDVDIQVGGNDQTFNMLAGRTLMRKMKNKEKFVVSLKLLVDPSGKKMGKTDGNMVALSDTPADIFGEIMSWPDTMILPGLELCAKVSMAEIAKMKKELEGGANPKDVKIKLAEAVVTLLHGEGAAKKASAEFDTTFAKGNPADFIEIKRDGDPMTTLLEKGIVASKTELRRLIAAGAVTHLNSNVKVGEDFATSFPTGKYRIGKHRFIEII